MKPYTAFDILLNVFAPLLLGAGLYLLPERALAGVLKNHAADGLWAYAFLSALLITWKRSLPWHWIAIAGLACCGYEALQYAQLAGGTGDVLDLLTYGFSFLLVIALNKLFKKQFNLTVCS